MGKLATKTRPKFSYSRETWLEARKLGVGASEVAALLGANPYKSPYELWAEKTGAIEPKDLSDNEAVEIGSEIEEVTLRILGKRTGREVEPWPQHCLRQDKEREHLFCTPDALQMDDHMGLGTAQAKNTGTYMAGQWTDGPPLVYQIQVQVEMHVMDVPYSTLCVIIGGNRFKWFDCERNQRFIDAMLAKVDEFWELIKKGTPPEIDASNSTADALARQFERDNGTVVRLHEEHVSEFEQLQELAEYEKQLKAQRQELQNRIKAAMGEASEGILPNGCSFTWKSQTRKEYVVKESSFRVLRLHEQKPDRLEGIPTLNLEKTP